MEPTTDVARADRAGHDLLLALAGRLPDRLLWRLRDWLAAGAGTVLRGALPRALVRHRVGITDEERVLLRTAVLGWGGSSRAVDAALHAESTPETGVTFAAPGEGPGWDSADLVLRALAPTMGGVGELRRAWRVERASRRADPTPPSRVVILAAAGDHPGLAALAGAVQRALRAQGEPDPRVEVIGPDSPTTAYHRDAVAASEVLWRADGPASASEPVGASEAALHFPDAGPDGPGGDVRGPNPRGPSTRAGELVRHG